MCLKYYLNTCFKCNIKLHSPFFSFSPLYPSQDQNDRERLRMKVKCNWPLLSRGQREPCYTHGQGVWEPKCPLPQPREWFP